MTDRLLVAISGVEGIAMANRGSRGRIVLTLAIIFDVGVLVVGILQLLLASGGHPRRYIWLYIFQVSYNDYLGQATWPDFRLIYP